MGCLRLLSVLAVLGALTALFVGCIEVWTKQKSYIFSSDVLDQITREALNNTEVGDFNSTFTLVEAELRKRYSDHIIPRNHTEWIFINAGGWMGAWYLLHASLTEYVLLFGTAVETSGHSGRYWISVSDTMVAGTYTQWKERTTTTNVYRRGEHIFHDVGEAAAVHWSEGTWMVEYGRGFIPSSLPFGILSDNLFSSQDFYVIYRSLRIYAIAVVQELLQGNV